MELLTLAATLVSIGVYLALGFALGRRTKNLGDHLPVTTGHHARVASAAEFSASTVAATISLATVVLAFFELAPYMGTWLLWTVVTTVAGIAVVRLAARKILLRMSSYGKHRPTLHEFLGREYDSHAVALVGAACTSLGFLGAFAVELTVGSRFLANLLPSVPPFLIVAVLAAVSLAYTSAGGFRAVIVTDRIQMKAIWLLLVALTIFYAVYIWSNGGLTVNLTKIPSDVINFSWREGLLAFLIGIFIINVPTFLSDMSVWQRIAGTEDPKQVFRGLWSSAIGAAVTWTLFVVLACLVPVIAATVADENPLLTLLHTLGGSYGIFGAVVLFACVLGLYGAMFSTASTQLVAVSHTVHLDIIRRNATNRGEIMASPEEVRLSRILIAVSAILAMAIVVILTAAGFSIADLVFAVYGAQLGLFPATLLALYSGKNKLKRLAPWALTAIALGFVFGWGFAGLGKYREDANLVFLAPAASLIVSSIVLSIGMLYNRVHFKNVRDAETNS
jgi:Na+/proline symporter